jgi:RND family efflux transporter MFP subunit
MSVWKQLALSLLVLLLAAAGWVRFFPGSHEILTSWGMDWAAAYARGASVESKDGDAGGRGSGGGGSGGGRSQQPASVVAASVANATINDKLTAIGTGRANNSVIVTPYSSGRLTEIAVEPGQEVEKGSLIARLDADTEQIAVDRARVAVDDAQSKFERLNALMSSNTVTTVQVRDAEVALENAKLARRDAELALERRSIVSPISGIVGIIQVELGNAVGDDTQIAMVDDRSKIIVDFWVPERFAGVIKVGAPLTATPIARPKEVVDGTVSAVDNRVDEASRTLRVRAVISNPDDTLRAGMSFQVAMRFPGDSYPSVNPLAVQWGGDGAFVWAIREGKAKRTPVRIIQRNTDSVLVEGDLSVEDLVVTEGIHTVREGADVQVASRGTSIVPPAAGASGGS